MRRGEGGEGREGERRERRKRVQKLTPLTVSRTSEFISNSARLRGGAISAAGKVVLTFNGTNNFINIFAATNISLSFTGTSNFSSNSAMQGGGICANRNTTLRFNGSISFINNGIHINAFSINSADNALSFGGAIYMGLGSTLFIFPTTAMYWENNHANVGGAIYVYNVNPLIYCTQIAEHIPNEKCFF